MFTHVAYVMSILISVITYTTLSRTVYKQSSIMLSLISFKMNGSRTIYSYFTLSSKHLSPERKRICIPYTMKHVPFLPEVLYEKTWLLVSSILKKAIHIPSYMEGI